MPETLLLVLALIIAIGVVAILVLLLRPRAAPVDLAAEQRMAELKAGSRPWANAGERAAQLQQTVNQRLDAVTQNLGESMKTSTKNTTDHLQQLHARLAVIDSAQKNITDLAAAGDVAARGARQQAVARRLRPGPHGSHHRRTGCRRALRIPVHAVEQRAAGLLRLHAGQPPLVIDAKFPLEAMTALREAKSDEETKLAAARAAPGPRQAHRRYRGEISDPRRDPGHRADVRAVGIGLCRAARRLRRYLAEGLPRQRHHRVAVAADAGDPGDPADSARTPACARRPTRF